MALIMTTNLSYRTGSSSKLAGLMISLLLAIAGLISSIAHAANTTAPSHQQIVDALKAVKHLNPFSIKATAFKNQDGYSKASLRVNNQVVTFVAYKPEGKKVPNIAFTTPSIKFANLLPDSISHSVFYKVLPQIDLINVTTILVPPKMSSTKEGETKVSSLPTPIKKAIKAAYKEADDINLPTGFFSIYQFQKSSATKDSKFFNKIFTKIPLGLGQTVTSFISLDASNYADLANAGISLSVVLKKDNPISKAVNATQILQSPNEGDRPVLTLLGSTSGKKIGVKYEAPYTALGKSRVYPTGVEFIISTSGVEGTLTLNIPGWLENPVIVPDGKLVDGIKVTGTKLSGVKMKDVELSLAMVLETKKKPAITPGFKAEKMKVVKAANEKNHTNYKDVEVKLAMTGPVPTGALISFKSNKNEVIDLLAMLDLWVVAKNSTPGRLTSNQKNKTLHKLRKAIDKLPKTGIKNAEFYLATPGMADSNHLDDFIEKIPGAGELAGAGVASKGQLMVLGKKIAKADLSLDLVNGLKIKANLKIPELKLEGESLRVDKASIDVKASWKDVPHFKAHGKLSYNGKLNPEKGRLTLSETKFIFTKSGINITASMGCIPPNLKFNFSTDNNFVPQFKKFPVGLSDCVEKMAKAALKETKHLGKGLGQELGINTDSPNTYKVVIDCYVQGNSLNSKFRTKDKVLVKFWNKTNLLKKVRAKVPNCDDTTDETYEYKTGGRVTHFSIQTDGKDAFWMDEVMFMKGGHLKKHYGRDGGGGYCLSEDSRDGKSFKSSGCHAAIMFYVKDAKEVYAVGKNDKPRPIPLAVNSAVNWHKDLEKNGKSYLFSSDEEYARYDNETRKMDSHYPKGISKVTWKGLPFNRIDAAVNFGNGKAYFFNNAPFGTGRYVRYDVKERKIDKGYPKPISSTYWKGLPFISIDAALNLGKGKAYFFSGTKYARYDIKANKMDSGYPKKISKKIWKGLPFKTIDAAVNWGNGKVYFFSGKKYARYDIEAGKMDSGYPKLTSKWWKGMK